MKTIITSLLSLVLLVVFSGAGSATPVAAKAGKVTGKSTVTRRSGRHHHRHHRGRRLHVNGRR